MTDVDRIAGLVAQAEQLPFVEREAFIATLSEEDREAVWEAQLDRSEDSIPVDYEDLGAGD